MKAVRFLGFVLVSAAAAVLGVGCVGDDAVESVEIVEPGYTEAGHGASHGKGNGECALKCAAPPEGCTYEGAVLTGKCNKLTCGELVCEPICAISCVAPPDGCHYEGAVTAGPCSQVTCGTLVCDGSSL